MPGWPSWILISLNWDREGGVVGLNSLLMVMAVRVYVSGAVLMLLLVVLMVQS